MSCIITYNKQGKATVKTPQGLDSTLYQEALDITGSQKKALEVVATIYSPEYQSIFTENAAIEPPFSKVVAFMNAKRVDEITITEDDILEVANIAFENNVESLTDLETILTEVFRPNGLLDIDQERLEDSGMYNQPDIIDLMNGNFNEKSINRTIDVVSKMIQDNMTLPLVDNDKGYNVTDTSVKNSLGMSKKMSDTEIINIILEGTKGYTSQADFSNKMQGLEVTPLVSRYNSDEKFAKEIFDTVSKYQVVPNTEIVNGELVFKQKGSTVSAINSTILLNTDSTELRSEIEDLLEIDDDILENDIEETKEFVKKIERLAADVNIDIIGLSEKTIPQIKKVLSATSLFAKKATQERIKNVDILTFSETRDKVLSDEGVVDDSFETIDEQYRGYNIVKLYTELGNEELFVEYGLIKIGENLYHKVDIANSSTEVLYDNLYRQVLEGTFELPREYRTPKEKFDPNNKPIILEALKSYINSKKNDLGITNVQVNERISLAQTLFKHKNNINSDINKVDAGNMLSGIKSNLNYLRTQFISDLYKYTLLEKQKGSQVYKQILSKLEFNNRDITLKSTNSNIQYALIALGDKFKYSQELRDYAAIKKNDPIKVLSIPTGVSPRIFPNTERISLANNPTLLGEYVGTIKRSNGYIITNTNDSFIKVNNVIYEKVGKNIFAPIDTTPSTNYYTIPTLTVDAETIKMLEIENPVINVVEPTTLEDFRSKYNTAVLTDKQVMLLSDLNATPHQIVKNSYTTKYGNTEINFTLNGKSNNVTIELIQTNVDSRGQGLAKAALNDFVRILDNNQFSSDLTVVPRDKTTSEAKLIGLYSSVGFRPGAIYDPNGGLVMMERRAKKLAPVAFQIDGETATSAQNLETTKLVSEYLKDKGFPINILSEQDMIEEARKRGYESFDAMVTAVNEQIQPLKAGERIHGFYDVNTNEIYLTEELLNSDTLIHETFHYYSKALEKLAKSGDPVAISLLNRFNEIGLEVLGGETKLKEYYDNAAKTNNASDTRFMTMPDGQQAQVRPIDAEVVNGFYSPLEKIINGVKQDKMPAKQWAEKFARGEEAKWTGLTDWLSQQQGSVSKSDIQQFLRDNKIEINEVVKGAKYVPNYTIESDPPAEFGATRNDLLGALMAAETIDNPRFEQYLENRYGNGKELLAWLKENTTEKGKYLQEEDTKYSAYQLEGEKNNYREVLVTMPRRYEYPAEGYTVKSREEYVIDKSNYTTENVPSDQYYPDGGFLIIGNRGSRKVIEKGYGIETAEQALDQYIAEELSIIQEIDKDGESQFDFYDASGNYFNSEYANSKEKAIENYKNTNKKEVGGFRSSHFSEANILVHLRMNTRTDSEGNKLLFLEEIQSDWGQEGKKKGFKNKEIEKEREKLRLELRRKKDKVEEIEKELDALKPLSSEERAELDQKKNKLKNLRDNTRNNRDWEALVKEIDIIDEQIDSYYSNTQILKSKIYELNYIGDDSVSNLTDNLRKFDKENPNEEKTSSAPFVMDTNTWAKLGLKVALKEAVKQGATKIAWTTGEQQNERYDLSKQVDGIVYKKNANETYDVDVFGFHNGTPNIKKKGLTINEVESNFGKEVAQKMLDSVGEDYKYENVSDANIEQNVTINGKKFADVIDELDSDTGNSRVSGYIDSYVRQSAKAGGDKSAGLEWLQNARKKWAKDNDTERVEAIDAALTYIKNADIKFENLDNKVLRGDNLRVGGKGMIGFYGLPSEKISYAEPVLIDGEGWAVKTLPHKYDPLGGTGLTTYPTRELAKAEADKQSESIAKSIATKDGVKENLGIVGNVAKSLFKQEPKTVKINNEEGGYYNELTKKFYGKAGQRVEGVTQHSIDITPELKAQVSEGLPLFKTSSSPFDSEVYSPRQDESYDNYKDRMINEAIARLMGENSVEYFETIAKEAGLSKTETKSFIDRVKQFLNDFAEWLKTRLGLTEYTPEQIANLSNKELFDTVTNSMLKGDYINSSQLRTEAEKYFTRNADRLPLTLAVFNRPEFVALQGKEVNPITVLNSLNQSGIKQIEKELIKKVIDDNYIGKRKISYDELEATVRANIMPLERITTSSYADYGMGNLGDGNYGEAKTLILNAPIEHGVTGHFSGAFKSENRANIKYVPKQLNDNTWVAVEEGYESQGANENNIYQFVGTAGTKEAVDSWIENYENPYKYSIENTTFIDGELKGKDGNLLSFFGNISHKEAIKNYNREQPNNGAINKGMFGHIRVWEDGEVFYVSELQSDFFQNNNARKGILEGREDYKKAKEDRYREVSAIEEERSLYLDNDVNLDLLEEIEKNERISIKPHRLELFNGDLMAETLWIFIDDKPTVVSKYTTIDGYSEEMQRVSLIKERSKLTALKNELGDEFADNLQKYYDSKLKPFTDKIAKVDKEFNKKVEDIVSNLSPQEKQFIASQKSWEQRMVREAIKEASLSGATSLRFPTPHTLSVIEGYVSETGNLPYEVERAEDDTSLEIGDVINYGGTEYTVIQSYSDYIEVAESEKVFSADIDSWMEEEIRFRTDDTMDYNLEVDITTTWTQEDWDNETKHPSLEDTQLEDIGEETEEGVYEISENKVWDIVEQWQRDIYENEGIESILSDMGYSNIQTRGGDVYYTEYRTSTETFGQPNTYGTADKDNFSIEDDLDDTQQTVARKYEEIARILKQERGEENVNIVTDQNGFDWYETSIESSVESQSPVVAFKVGKAKDKVTLTEKSPLLETYNGMFSKETTGLSYYDDLMNADSENPGYQFFYKGLKARVEMMSPQDYLQRVRAGFGTTIDEAIVEGKKDRILKAIEEGNKIDMGFLNYSNGRFEQEGRNRATVAAEIGENLIPTLIINDVTQEDKNNKAQEFINEALSKGITGEDNVIQYLKDTYNIHRDFTNFLRFKGDNLNFETLPKNDTQFKIEKSVDNQTDLINKKVKEIFTNLNNPINVVTLYTEQDLKDIDACR